MKDVLVTYIFFISIVFILAIIVFPKLNGTAEKEQLEKEALQKGRPVQALIIDKKYQEGSSANPTIGDPGSPPTFKLKIYHNEKTANIDVKKELYNSVHAGETIDAIEYEEHLVLKK